MAHSSAHRQLVRTTFITSTRRVRTAVLVAAVAALQFGPAGGSHPGDSSLEQQWELVSAPQVVTSTKTVTISRGAIGGASFSPAPSVTMEAVGRVQGATGDATWSVELRSPNAVLGTVVFGAEDDQFTLEPNAAPMSWPSEATDLLSLRIVPAANGIGNLTGTFTLRKAHLRLAQGGTVTSSKGRLPLAPQQTVTNSTWKDLEDALAYTHRAGDFDPVPTIRLRVTAEETSYPLYGTVRIVDSSGSYAGGMEFWGAGGASSRLSAPLNLEDGETYRLQAQALQPSWTIFSADLEFVQSTSEEHGLKRAVSWYPSTVTPVQLIDSSKLNFAFSPPTYSVENLTAHWLTTIRRTSSLGSVRADLVTGTGAEVIPGEPTSSGNLVTLSSSVPLGALGGTAWDSKPVLSNGGEGRLAASVLQLVSQLRDTIALVEISEPVISPNGDGSKDTTTITATSAPDGSFVTWDVKIIDAMGLLEGDGSVVRTLSAAGSPMSVEWDGSIENIEMSPGDVVTEWALDGTYTIEVTATDPTGNTATRVGEIAVDTREPIVERVYPADGENSAYTSQPVFAQVTDRGAGVDPQTLAISLTDETIGTATNYTATMIDFNSETGWMSTPAATLQAGHVYSIGVTAKDLVGNAVTPGQQQVDGFLATAVSLGSTSASIPARSCNLSAIDSQTQTRTASCGPVPLTLSPASVTVEGSKNSGQLFARIVVPLESAILSGESSAGPASLPASSAAQGSWDPVETGFNFFVKTPTLDPISGSAFDYGASDLALGGSLNFTVPAHWTSAQIEMAPISVPLQPSWCADPRSGKCTPNPVTPVHTDWRPPATSPHFEACDTVLSHKQPLAVPPSQDLQLSVSVDTQRFSATELLFHYQIGEESQPVQLAQQAGGSTQYSFTIPASLLSEGTAVDYGFTVMGSFADPDCSSWAAAQSPAWFGFRALATGDVNWGNDELQHVGETAWLNAQWTPTLSSDPSAQEICAAVFQSPTPCEIPNGTADPPPDDVIGTVVTGTVSAAGSSGGPRGCRVWSPEHSEWRRLDRDGAYRLPEENPPATFGTRWYSWSSASPAEPGYFRPETHSNSSIYVSDDVPCVEVMGITCEPPNPGLVQTLQRSRIGMRVGVEQLGSNVPDSYDMTVRLHWGLTGTDHVNVSMGSLAGCIGMYSVLGCALEDLSGDFAHAGTFWAGPPETWEGDTVFEPSVRRGYTKPNGDIKGKRLLYSSERLAYKTTSHLNPADRERTTNRLGQTAWKDVTMKVSKDTDGDGAISESERKSYLFYAELHTGSFGWTSNGIAEAWSDFWNANHDQPNAALWISAVDVWLPQGRYWAENGNCDLYLYD